MIQGKTIPPPIIDQIIKLLRKTNMSMVVIAERMKVDLKTVHTVNKLENIRDYRGKRRSWVCGGEVCHE